MSRRALTILLAALAGCLLCYLRAERTPYARTTSHAFELIESEALENPPDEELLAGAVRGMVAVLRERGDRHSSYLEPASAEPLRAEMRQQFGGVGIRIGLRGDPPLVVVLEPPEPGTPAFGSAIRSGDAILAVDGADATGKTIDAVATMTRGPVGEPVEITVRHEPDQSTETVRLVRAVIRLPSVLGDRRNPDGGWEFQLEGFPSVALVRLVSFGDRSAEELRSTLDGLTADGVEVVLLDVRGNPGGSISAAIDVAGLFLPDGAPIVSTRGRDGKVEESFGAVTDGPFDSLELYVLVDGDSASASEIVAAALQDNGRAKVVGERSFGKGTVQQLIPLGPQRAMLKLTSSSYWRPSGVNIHRTSDATEDDPWGVTPDVLVAISEAQRNEWRTWRRSRDLLAESGETPGAPVDPLTADDVVAAAIGAAGLKR